MILRSYIPAFKALATALIMWMIMALGVNVYIDSLPAWEHMPELNFVVTRALYALGELSIGALVLAVALVPLDGD